MIEIKRCPSTLQEGFETYNPKALKTMFGGKRSVIYWTSILRSFAVEPLWRKLCIEFPCRVCRRNSLQ